MKFSSLIFFSLFGLLTFSYFFKPNKRHVKRNQPNIIERKKINNNNIDFLIKILRDSDKRLLPVKVIDSRGTVSYKYTLIEGEKKLNLKEIKYLINNPPKNEIEIEFLKKTINMLNNSRVNVFLEKPKIIGASAEWDYKEKTIRFNPKIIKSGTKAFVKSLNHEIIHVIQSCIGGGFKRKPTLIGLKINDKNKIDKILENPIYKNLPYYQYQLELEAYSYQNDLTFSPKSFTKYCL